MSRIIRDADGTPYVRGRDGDLVPVSEDDVTDRLPPIPQGARCPDHGVSEGFAARGCPACSADVLAGDRPRTHVGRHWPIHPET